MPSVKDCDFKLSVTPHRRPLRLFDRLGLSFDPLKTGIIQRPFVKQAIWATVISHLFLKKVSLYFSLPDESSTPCSPKVEGRVSPVTLKLKTIPDSAGSVLEMVVEKVKAREGTVSPPMPKMMLGLEESKEVGRKRRTSNDSEDVSQSNSSVQFKLSNQS